MNIGEYQSIIDRTKQIKYLILAHCTPCSQKEAINIARKISKVYFKDEKWIVVKFNCKRGSGGIFRDKRLYIELPKKRMYHPYKSYGRLRIGLVLHELAHGISDFMYGNSKHGIKFMRTYDKLLKKYYETIE